MAEPESKRPGRNEPCHCGSGKKYKHCCLSKDEEAALAATAEQAAAAQPAPPPEEEQPARTTPPRRVAEQPWKKTGGPTQGFRKISGPRKVGGG